MKLEIDWPRLRKKARTLILAKAKDAAPGPEKMDALLRELLKDARQRLDDAIDPQSPAAEAVSDALIAGAMAVARSALRHLAQEAYEELKGEGKLGGGA